MTSHRSCASERRIVLHLGMLKTGSTSIQDVWNGYKDDQIEYADLGLPNHSLVLQSAFLEGKAADRVFRNQTPEKRVQQHSRALQKVGDALDRTERSVIFSGEGISNNFDKAACQRCMDFLQTRASRIDALLYVRAPESYVRSVFQERLKKGLARFEIGTMVPAYRNKATHWAEVLGADPTYVLFDRSVLLDGDVVADFGARLGLDPAWAKARAHLQNRNTSLSAEATAALYLLRHQRGAPAAHKEGRMDQKRLIQVLGGYGTRRYDFSRDLMEAALAERADEIAWMEERLGRPFPEETVKDPVIFASEREILKYGEAQAVPLREHLRERGIIGAKVNGSTIDVLEAVLNRTMGFSKIRREFELHKGRLGLALGRLGKQFVR